MEKIISDSFQTVTQHRLPETLVQKILHYALPYNMNYKNLHSEMATNAIVKETIQKLDNHYYNFTFNSLSKNSVSDYIEKLYKCRCCKNHLLDKLNPAFCQTTLVRQNACLGKPKHICTCSCAFYIKELIFQYY